jgi:hypothetical protein
MANQLAPVPDRLQSEGFAAGPARSGGSVRRRRWKILVVCLVAVAVGAAAGTYEVGRREGFTRGDEAGFARGHTAGYGEGRLDGYEDGKSDGFASGRSTGRAEGYADGRKDGFDGGWRAGCLAVFTTVGDTTVASWRDVDGLFDPFSVSTVSSFACY